MKIFETILDLLFPTTCELCKNISKEYICEKCFKEIKDYIIKTNIRTTRFHLLKYKDFIRNEMILYKFYDKSYLYKMFCQIYIKDKNACEFIKNYDIIIPVPIHKKRMLKRGYNQSELIAKFLGEYFHIVVYTDVLKKQKNAKQQSKLKKEQRISNIKSVYKVENVQKILGKKILILDDIYTTGATANECKKTLSLAGAKEVGILTIAKD